MARMPRVVVPGFPHHVTQRGNRRQKTFFSGHDYRDYTDLLATAQRKAGVQILAYCLMPNHVHLVVVPEHESSLSKLFSEAHRKYSRKINLREGWRGHLWQERFFSCVMDERHLLATVRYVELNPVRAKLCAEAVDWPWSSVHAHLANQNDDLVNVAPMLELVNSWENYLQIEDPESVIETIRLQTRTGRPAGSTEFVQFLEKHTGRRLEKQKPGRKASE